MKVLTVILGVCAYSALSLLAATAISEEKSGNDNPSYIVAWTGPDEGVWLQLFDRMGLQLRPYEFSNIHAAVRPARHVTDALLLSSGETVVAYRERNQRYTWLGNYLQFYDSQGVEKAVRIKLDTTCDPWGAQLAQVTHNSFIVSRLCSDRRGLMVDEFDIHGNRLTEQSIKLIKEQEKLDLYRISSFQNGSLLVTWRNMDRENKIGPTAIKAQTFDRKYNSISPVIDVATYKERTDHPAYFIRDPVGTTLTDGRFVIAWREGGMGSAYMKKIFGRVYSIDGEPASMNFVIGAGHKPEITELSNSDFAITWIEGGKLLVKRYNHLGKEKGARKIVNDNGLNPRFGEPVGLKNGVFAVSWYGCEIESNGCEHFSRVFGNDGKPLRPSERIYHHAPPSTKASGNLKWKEKNRSREQ